MKPELARSPILVLVTSKLAHHFFEKLMEDDR